MNRELDRALLLAIIFLLGLGIVQVYSSSFIFAVESKDDGLFFVKKQALFALVGLIVLLVVAGYQIKWVEKFGLGLWGVAVLGILLTLVPGLGVTIGGGTRWLNIGGGFRFEPSELLKYTYPVLAAFVISKIKNKRESFLTLGLYGFLVIIPFLILLRQPDFGSVALISFMLIIISFSQGLKWRYLASGVVGIGVAGYFMIVNVPYRLARVQSFLDPWSDPGQKGFQVIQSMLGYYSGGLTGVGLGQGQGKLYFLPEAHTDFTMSVLGEELGFLGFAFVILIFGFVIFRGLQISVESKNLKWQIMAFGSTLIFGLTAWVNAGVTLGLLPTKGLGMPFLSYGGSALIAGCFGLGLLLNIDRQNLIEKRRSFIKI